VLTRGNAKLGHAGRVWGFALPARATCPGRSPVCSSHCYAYRLERFRPAARRKYARNLALSRRPDFPDRVVRFVTRHRIAVVRVHVGGDFYSPAYARKWLAIARRLPVVTFYFYTRSWRAAGFGRVLAALARAPNVRAWFSCDRSTGVPRRVPPGVRLAWLQADPGDIPPQADLVFRVRRLRALAHKHLPCTGGPPALVCPVENGATGPRTDCTRCGVCWRPAPASDRPARLGLPVLPAGTGGAGG
jgi:hypothetical protein